MDPTGHFQVELSAEEADELMKVLEQISSFSLWSGIASEGASIVTALSGGQIISNESVALILGLPAKAVAVILALSGIDMMLTYDDLNNIRIAMGDLGADETGAKISINPRILGSKLTITTKEGSRTLTLRNWSLVGSAAPMIFGGMMVGYSARGWLFPNEQYKAYLPFVAR